VKGAVVEERLRVDGGDISQTPIDASELRFHARPLASDRMLLELAPYWAAVAKDVRQVPVGYPVGPLNWSIAAPSYRDERVTVPAGSFATVRVQVTGRSAPIGSLSNTTANFATRFVYTYWYSPEHARYVKIRHQTWNQVNQGVGDEVVELLRYESP
jgi:hypothetical protein